MAGYSLWVLEYASQTRVSSGDILYGRHDGAARRMPYCYVVLRSKRHVAMVGTRELGQQVYIALGKADAGLGFVAGLSIALLAMISDRIIRGWCSRRQAPTAR